MHHRLQYARRDSISSTNSGGSSQNNNNNNSNSNSNSNSSFLQLPGSKKWYPCCVLKMKYDYVPMNTPDMQLRAGSIVVCSEVPDLSVDKPVLVAKYENVRQRLAVPPEFLMMLPEEKASELLMKLVDHRRRHSALISANNTDSNMNMESFRNRWSSSNRLDEAPREESFAASLKEFRRRLGQAKVDSTRNFALLGDDLNILSENMHDLSGEHENLQRNCRNFSKSIDSYSDSISEFRLPKRSQ